MNIRTSLLCSALAVLVTCARSDDTTVVVTPSVVSQYMFRGQRLGGAAFQPTVEVDSGNLAIGVWASTPLRDKVPGQSDPEIDPYGSYTLAINDSLNVAPGFTWYNYPNADASNGFFKSTFEPNLALNYTVSPLKDLGTELDFTATGGTYIIRDFAKGAEPKVKNWGDYFLVGVSAPIQITKASKVIVGFAYSKGSGNYLKQGSAPKYLNSSAVGRGVVTVSYAFTF